MKQTKENLIKENAILEKELQIVKDKDDRMRDIFSKILGSVKHYQHSVDDTRIVRLSWFEIIYQIGYKDGEKSNLSDTNFLYNLEQSIGDIRQRIDKLESIQK